MVYIIILFLLNIFLVLVVVCLFYQLRKMREHCSRGLGEYCAKKKLDRKEKILEYLSKHKSITNDAVQKLTGVSDATATTDMQEIEYAGIVAQTKQKGSGVKYELRT